MGLALLHSEQAVRVERMEKLIFTRVHAEAGPGVVTGNTFAIQNSLYLEQFPFSLNHCFFSPLSSVIFILPKIHSKSFANWDVKCLLDCSI